MAPIYEQLAFNVAAATVLAVPAYLSRFLGRPTFTHWLWLIVLARLVVPPVWTIPLPRWQAETPITEIVTSDHPETIVAISPEIVDAIVLEPSPFVEDELNIVATSATVAKTAIPWERIAIGIWLTGTMFYCLLLIAAVIGVMRMARHGKPADADIADHVFRISRLIGLRRPPRVRVIADRISPCVGAYPFCQYLFVPDGFVQRLQPVQLEAVLIHEMAHLKRGDHWVRWFECIVVGCFWWHPVVWIARRELREVEELCCDEWVTAMLPAARRAYALALVDTADFLMTTGPELPPLASGLGQVRELQRRISMILSNHSAKRPGKAGAIVALGLGLMLPLGVARSDDGDDAPPAPPPPANGERRDDAPPPPPPPPPPPAQSKERRRDNFDDREREIRARERAMQDKAMELEKAAREIERVATRERNRADGDDRAAETRRLRAQLDELEAQMAKTQVMMERIRRRLQELGDNQEPPRNAGPRPREAGVDAPRVRAPRTPDGPGPVATPHPPAPPTPAQGPGAGRGGPGHGPGPTPRPGAGDDRRFEAMERQLEALRRELVEMRRDRERDRERRPDRPPEP